VAASGGTGGARPGNDGSGPPEEHVSLENASRNTEAYRALSKDEVWPDTGGTLVWD